MGKIGSEVGKGYHMRVARRRHYVVGAIPGRQYYASPLSFPLTHPQPCWAWSMIITWQQVEIMRGESPKSYVRVVRAWPTSCRQLNDELHDGGSWWRSTWRSLLYDREKEFVGLTWNVLYLILLFVLSINESCIKYQKYMADDEPKWVDWISLR